jgi:hypothetical protein
MTQGFIKLHRKILNWEWFSDNNTFRLFIYCLLRANHQDTKWRGLIIKKGSFITSLPKLNQQTKLSIQNIRTSINKLKSTGEITDKATNKNRIITIVNWDLYQQTNRQTNSPLTDNQQTTNRQTNRQLTADKNEKKIKNDKNEKKNIDVDFLFEEFYSMYPLKKGKAKGKAKFFSLFKNLSFKEAESLFEKMMKGLENYCNHIKSKIEDQKYIKHFSTFMNGKHWEDEYDKILLKKNKNSPQDNMKAILEGLNINNKGEELC